MKSLSILVVEDDQLLGELLAELLEAMGHTVCGIESTEAGAVAAAFRSKPDLMIIDAGLGDGSGISALKQICDSGFIPHVFASGDISKIKESRPTAVALEKPFRESDLIRAIQRALETS